ncbi:alpha/beta hydrolase [Williamsia sterculiae]|uniref:Alpha/beta hydrolase n=1 Tax=Williamsia sterculiae TaxID=1344003 RepID=A0A1N7EJL3_9NOCA|nr:alpha/beta hydrolase [Williamsia sterculiae]SIR88168.1 Alpha/beta hydrolase [Williamsia sterculiae]
MNDAAAAAAIVGWDVDGLDTAGVHLADHTDALDGALDAVLRGTDSITGWSGGLRDAVRRRIDAEVDHGREIRNALYRLADGIGEAAADLRAAQAALIELGPAHHAATDAVHRAVLEAESVDAGHASTLDAIVADLTALHTGPADIRGPDGTRCDPDRVVRLLGQMEPEARYSYVSGLSDTDVGRLVDADPQFVGNTDGIPFPVRIKANAVGIRVALAAELRADRPDAARVNRLRDLLRPIPATPSPGTQTVSADVRPHHLRERQIIGFDADGDGRLVEMFGTLGPGTRGAGLFVPGTGASLDDSGESAQTARDLADASGCPVILWVGGDFPDTVTGHASTGAGAALLGGAVGVVGAVAGATVDGASNPVPAARMASDLVAFGRALDREVAAHSPGASTTVLGHSYGGSVVGSAEQQGLRADRVVYASSAGTGVFLGGWQDADLRVQRFSMTAPGDPIQYVQELPWPHGGDPDDASGVTRLDTGHLSDGRLVTGLHGHGDYLHDPGSDGFRNIATVIGGGHPTPYVDRGPDTVLDRPPFTPDTFTPDTFTPDGLGDRLRVLGEAVMRSAPLAPDTVLRFLHLP